MSRLEIDWPDADAERARAARGRLEQASEALASIPFDERLATMAEAARKVGRPMAATATADLLRSLADRGALPHRLDILQRPAVAGTAQSDFPHRGFIDSGGARQGRGTGAGGGNA